MRAVCEYLKHHHAKRNYPGFGKEMIELNDEAALVAGKIECR